MSGRKANRDKTSLRDMPRKIRIYPEGQERVKCAAQRLDEAVARDGETYRSNKEVMEDLKDKKKKIEEG